MSTTCICKWVLVPHLRHGHATISVQNTSPALSGGMFNIRLAVRLFTHSPNSKYRCHQRALFQFKWPIFSKLLSKTADNPHAGMRRGCRKERWFCFCKRFDLGKKTKQNKNHLSQTHEIFFRVTRGTASKDHRQLSTSVLCYTLVLNGANSLKFGHLCGSY